MEAVREVPQCPTSFPYLRGLYESKFAETQGQLPALPGFTRIFPSHFSQLGNRPYRAIC